MRSGPGTGFPSLGLIDPAQKVQIVYRDAAGQWYAVLYPAAPGGLGWVTAAFVQVADPAGIPVLIPTGTPTPAGPTGVAQQTLNVRSGPGTSYDLLGTLPSGTILVLTGKNAGGAWLQVEFLDVHGWVTAAYVKAGDLSGLPVLDSYGTPVPAGTVNTPGPYLSPLPTVGPAPDNGDSPSHPAFQVNFSPGGTRQFAYSGQLSAPQGDGEDWIAFSPYAVPGSAPRLTASLACSGNGSLAVELLQGGSPVASWGSLQCGEADRPLALSGGGTFVLHLSAVPASAPVLVAYTLTVRSQP